MKKQLILLLTLSALLTYRAGHAQAAHPGDSPTLVASVHTKPAPARATSETAYTKTVVTAKKETANPKKSQNAIGRTWSRIMGICHEVHQASTPKKKTAL